MHEALMMMDASPGAELSVRLLRSERALAAVAEGWNTLTGGIPFRRYEWLSTWWRHFRQPSDELYVPSIYDAAGRLVGLAPWYITRRRWLGKIVRFLGSGAVCSEYLSVLAAAGTEDAVARRLAHWLSNDARHWDLLDLDGVDASDPALLSLTGGLEEIGHSIFQRTRGSTWRVELAATWDDFLGRLSKGRRAKIRTHERRLAAGGVALKTAGEDTSLDEGLEVFHRLHRARRASRGQQGCTILPSFERFIKEAAAQLESAGELRIQWIEAEGQPAAVELDLISDGTLYYYQSGMNPDLADISPGWLLQVASIKRAIGGGLKHFDFLRGDEAYKASWGAEPRTLAQIRVAARRPFAELRHHAWQAALKVKQKLPLT